MLAKDMTRGNPLQQILFFALPVMLTNICQQCYRIADAAVVGRCLGDTALGAVGGASEPLLFVVISFFCGLAIHYQQVETGRHPCPARTGNGITIKRIFL